MKPIEVTAAVTYYNIKKESKGKKCSNFLLKDSFESDNEEDDRQLFSRTSSPNKIVKIPPSQRLLKRRDAIVISKTGDFDKIYKWSCCRCVTNNNKSSMVCDHCQHQEEDHDLEDLIDEIDSPLSRPSSNCSNGKCKFMRKNKPNNSVPVPVPVSVNANDNSTSSNIVHYFRNANECSNKKQRLDQQRERDCIGGNCSIV